MNKKITLKDFLDILIQEHGSIETAERYKSIYEDYDQEVYGKAVGYLEQFLEEILVIENKEIEINGKSKLTLSEAVRSSESKPGLYLNNLQ
jgi:hypothetical protein